MRRRIHPGDLSLHVTASRGYGAVVKLLLKKGASFNESSLIIAAENRHEAVVKLLTKAAGFSEPTLVIAVENGTGALPRYYSMRGLSTGWRSRTGYCIWQRKTNTG